MQSSPTWHPVYGLTHHVWFRAARQVKGNPYLRNLIMCYSSHLSFQDLVFKAAHRRHFMRLYHRVHREVIWHRTERSNANLREISFK